MTSIKTLTRVLAAGVAAGAMALSAGAASAATITLNSTADLSLAAISGGTVQAGDYWGVADALPLSDPFTVTVGDTLIVNMDFAGNQQLTITDLSFAWPLVITQNYDQASTINMTGFMELLGANGSVVASTAPKTNSDGAIHIAQVFDGSEFGSPASVTFAGFRYTGVVNSADIDPRTYDGPSLLFQGSSATLSEFTTGVPEPGTWALMILGIGAAGSMIRRRKAVIA